MGIDRQVARLAELPQLHGPAWHGTGGLGRRLAGRYGPQARQQEHQRDHRCSSIAPKQAMPSLRVLLIAVAAPPCRAALPPLPRPCPCLCMPRARGRTNRYESQIRKGIDNEWVWKTASARRQKLQAARLQRPARCLPKGRRATALWVRRWYVSWEMACASTGGGAGVVLPRPQQRTDRGWG